MRHTRRGLAGVAVTAVLVMVASACSGGLHKSGQGTTSAGSVAHTPRMKIAMITHQSPGDTFWDIVRKGAMAAAAKDNFDLEYSADPQAANQATLMQDAINAHVKGIAVTLAYPSAMRAVVGRADAAGIPVVAFNSGIENWQQDGAMMYFGEDETAAGQQAGQRLDAEGAKDIICVDHEQGNVSQQERCDGVRDTFKGSMQVLYVNGADMPSVQSAITAKLQRDRNIDTVLTLGAPYALTAVQAVKNAGSSARIATFDTNAQAVNAIKNGQIEWAVDQQPYLQGYLAVDSLWLYLTNGDVVGGGKPVPTGPSFIDKSNVGRIAQYAANGTR